MLSMLLKVLGISIFHVHILYITGKCICANFSLEIGRNIPENCWLKNKENTAAEATLQH